LEGVGFRYGVQKAILEDFIAYWRDDYLPRWSQREELLNSFPHFTTEVQGLNIDFIHVKPKTNKRTVPLLLLHGWPGSVREFYEIIPKLTTASANSDFVFEVIAPSLPGYGWSDGASLPGFGPAEIAIVLRNLMLKIGHNKFLIQGGDWGSLIGKNIASFFPENTLGYHSNMCGAMSAWSSLKLSIASFYPSYFIPEEYIDFVFPSRFRYLIEETGYFHIQATKPDTIGAVLSNNPVGLAAYLLEKFSTWAHPDYRNLDDGGLNKVFSRDALLDNIMIYYLTNSITTSVRLYSESFTDNQRGYNLDRVPVPASVPVGCARFKHDLLHSLDWQLKDVFLNLVHSSYHTNGGHFAALERPNELYDDFISFVKKSNLKF